MVASRRFKRAGLLATAACVALMLVPAASPAVSPPYKDASGDNGPGGDVTGVTITSDRLTGQIILRVTGANLSRSPDQLTGVDIDSDANPLTGDIRSGGADYWFGVAGDGYGFEHWNGTDWVDTAYATVRISGGGGGLMISVNRSELGNTSDFNFDVETMQLAGQDDANRGDSAPDDGMYNYSLDAGGPLIVSADVQTKPSAGPRAGRSFSVVPTNLKLPPTLSLSAAPIVPDSYACKATVKAKALVGRGTGGCTFRVPKKTRGKSMKVVLTVSYQGATKAFPLTFSVT
jgi:hypothetical protein